MRRLITVLVVLLLVAGAGFTLYLVGRGHQPSVKLSDGTVFTVRSTETGPYQELRSGRAEFLHRLLRILPDSIEQYVTPRTPVGRSFGRSWSTHAYQEESLHLWFSLFLDDNPIDPDPFQGKIYIADAGGTLYRSYGQSRMGTGMYKQPEFVCHSFSAFPRWQPTLRLVVREPGREPVLSSVTISNPDYRPEPSTNWAVQPVPQEVKKHGVTFRLAELRREDRSWWGRAVGNASGEFEAPYQWVKKVESVDSSGVSNAWHVARQSVYDNYGNHDVKDLPALRRPGGPLADLQWRLEVVLCSDRRSSFGSNHFWTLPSMTLPKAGEANSLNHTNRQLGPLDFQFGVLSGKGRIYFTNGVFTGIELPEEGIAGNSSSTTYRPSDDDRVDVTLTRADPHLVYSVAGPFTNFQFSCQAIHTETGDALWLGEYRPSKTPVFSRQDGSDRMLVFNCKELDNDAPYRFVLGAHSMVEVNFFVAAPELEDE